MMLNVTFNNITVISWRSVLLVEETGIPGENHRPVGKAIKEIINIELVCKIYLPLLYHLDIKMICHKATPVSAVTIYNLI